MKRSYMQVIISISSNDELCSIVDSTVQNTLLNVIIEANLGEFTVDNPLCSITKLDDNCK